MVTVARIDLTKYEEELVHTMQLLGDRTRYKIFKLLISEEELCVSEIADRLDVSVSAVSQHFRNFEIVGLVCKERMGQKICYAIRQDNEIIRRIIKLTSEG